VRYEAGRALFQEGDPSEELYVLVSGTVDVIKGNQVIRQISEPGALFGEMSHLLDRRRTATIKARTPVEALRIPREAVEELSYKFSALHTEQAHTLAQRLHDTSQILQGLRLLCDQLPQAVVLTDREARILIWNRAAEALFGCSWTQDGTSRLDGVFQDPGAYHELLEEARKGCAVCDRTFGLTLPQGKKRTISLTASVLFDAHHNFQGILFQAKDLTTLEKAQRNYRRLRRWILPLLLVIGLLGGAVIWGFPYFSRGYMVQSERVRTLQAALSKDCLLVRSLVQEGLHRNDPLMTKAALQHFLQVEDPQGTPFEGVVVLDREKEVVAAISLKGESELEALRGTSYVGIPFEGDRRSPHRVLTLYRPKKGYPLGARSVEVAFEVRDKSHDLLGWILFVMDMKSLDRDYGMKEQGLRALQFTGL